MGMFETALKDWIMGDSTVYVKPETAPIDSLAWFTSLPTTVQKLVVEFPGGRYGIGDRYAYHLGWTDRDELLVSIVDPSRDREFALECAFRQPAECYRKPSQSSVEGVEETGDDKLPGPLQAMLEMMAKKGVKVGPYRAAGVSHELHLDTSFLVTTCRTSLLRNDSPLVLSRSLDQRERRFADALVEPHRRARLVEPHQLHGLLER